MRQWHAGEQEEKPLFAREAAVHFAQNPMNVTYTRDAYKEGSYLALRYGLGNDCVAVLKLCEYTEPLNYCQFVDYERAKLTRIYHEAGMAALSKEISA